MAELSKSDLEFILQQILIAEAHAAGGDLLSMMPSAFAPFGLRTVDGSFNNLIPGQSEFGAADNNFPTLLDPVFRNDQDGDTFGQITNTNYATTTSVADADPRIISNLIVDQTANNPAAVIANGGADPVVSPGLDGIFGTADDREVFLITNTTPDEGLSAPFNGWFTFFGQFFDHGLDLVNKGDNGTIFIPLMPDDPLYNPNSSTNFMVLTRATNTATAAGADGVFNTADDVHFHNNQTTPFVDQNQTYTSHPSHQVFLREYALVDHDGNPATPLRPLATGRLLDGAFGGLPTWAEVKEQARTKLGIHLTDADVTNLPGILTDPYGKFLPGPNGFAQLITTTGVLEGDPSANGGLGITIPANVIRTNHAFLDDIAHTAVPIGDHDGNPATPPQLLTPDADNVAGPVPDGNGGFLPQPAGTYDNELLDAHFVTGDGRGNENIGLTTVHHVFHAEHNRQIAAIKATLLTEAAANGVAFLNAWLTTDVAAVPTTPDGIAALQWDGERLFQAARFATEMQYQHLVFEEFARKVQPNIDEFLAPIGYDITINPAIVAEFAHVVYRFGHSMLTETVDRYDPNFNVIDTDPLHPAQTGSGDQLGLIAAFLNPLAFAASGANATEAAGAIVRGMTRVVGNEIDEFVTEALRNNLVGLPLDLPTINLARGRDTGVPSLNVARREFFAMTQDAQLAPYTSWVDFAAHLKHEESVINFIAAYGTHASITSATTTAAKRAAALAIVTGEGFTGTEDERLAFLNGPAASTGVDDIDLWIGGLAEKQMPFGGLLGSTFNFVFETQLEKLQNGDRFYYLSRTAGLDFAASLENNSFAKLIMLNTDVTHLPADVFSTPTHILEVDSAKQFTGLGVEGRDDPLGGTGLIPLVIRDNPGTPGTDTNYLRYTGPDHVVLGGTAGNDTMIASIGDDTIYGDGGNDRIDGGDGVDNVFGGDGDDIITDLGGDDVIHGDAGNDVIQGGNGLNLIHGDSGQDFIITGEDITVVFAGPGSDFVLGSKTNLEVLGNEGDDWLEFGHQEGTVGDNFDPNGLDKIAGHDVFIGGGGFEDIIAEGGDDIIFGSDGQEKMDGASGFDWANYKFETAGVTADLKISTFRTAPATPSTAGLLDLYAFVEGLSGTPFGDVLRGDDMLAAEFPIAGAQGSVLTQEGIDRIAGLQTVVGAGATSFIGGNIILGGDGSDIIEGRQGDDIIDGDRWLNARISVRANIDGTGPEIRSVDSMRDLIPDMLAGTINPGQLVIVREINTAAGPDFDTAMYSGPLANYTISTAFDGTTVVRDNVGTILGSDGTDTLRNIERLQFSDQAVILPSGVGRNAAPIGLLQIRDAGTNAADNTPAVNQLLTVFAGNVTDADVAGGSIAGKPISYYWQVERGLNSGYFEDIITPNGLGGAATTADGPTLRVPTTANGLALDGLRLRVRAVYQDDNGVMENVFSAPTQAVAGVVAGPPAPAPIPAESSVSSPGIHLIRSDLQFILDQIVIAERHAAGEDLLTLVGNERLPYGLRTVDGSFNNLVPGQTEFGAADNNFPLLLDQVFRNDQDGDIFDANGPAPGGLITNTNYATTTDVVDADPRIISNLIVDQTANNPAAVIANGGADPVVSPGLDGIFGTADDREVFLIPNTTPDEGLSAPFNSWMTLFGQFFDHGLDLVNKGNNGTVFVPLQPDDPRFIPGSPTNFMVLTRATNTFVGAGADGVFNTADDVHLHNNQTTPFVDQNQTYTSHPSHQVFLREYVLDASGRPVATGRMLDGAFGGLPTWAEVKAQAQNILGVVLDDQDVLNLPLVAADAYGKFIPGPDGFVQLVTPTGLQSATSLATSIDGSLAFRTNHAFLDDIAHSANPSGGKTADADITTGNPVGPTQYDNELLDAHFVTGDGRGNENIGLTAVHHVFHAEHNRLVQHIQDVILASNDPTFSQQWLLPGANQADGIQALEWNGERLFQAARFGTEMQYQHLVFEEFARTVQPQIDLFFATTQVYDTALNPAIVDEFAHVVYRFGHSMLTETVDRYDSNFNVIDTDPLHPAQTGSGDQLGLIAAFLNPLAFAASGANATEAAGAIVRGMTRQVGNEIDEFVTEALRNNLVGLPLDLATINLARGRDAGVPSLNAARQEFYNMTGDAQLAPYTSWVDFAAHLKHEESVINFIAAYGTHASITSAATTADKRAAALAIVTGEGFTGTEDERLAFLNGPAASTGVNVIDLWIGGLAEKQMPFGGLLGSTFNFVFETQLEKLQDADRFYYLERTGGLNFLTELEGNSFAKLVMANTNATHLPGVIFTTPTFVLEVDQTKQFNAGLGSDDPTDGSILNPLVTRDPLTNFLKYTGVDHVVMGGTTGNDIIIASIGDDTLYGDGGNDRLEGGDGVDMLLGGDGDDIITDLGGDDVIQGGEGHDAIQGGNGINLVIGGFGQDFINSGEDASEVFGGPGNDFILGSRANEQDMGNEGDDWLEHGNADGSPGDNFDPFGRDPVVGNDVYIGDTVVDIMNAEGGDDIMVGNGGQQDHYLGASGFDWAVYKDSPVGVIVLVDLLFENEATALGANPSTLDRYQSVEGISGSQYGDILIGSDSLTPSFATSGFNGSILTNIDLIDGLRELLPAEATSFTGEILLGGAGSDLIKGGWGDEIIDGDAWLNVQIGVYDDLAHTNLLSRHNSMLEIQDQVFAGLINPGQLGIIREIRTTMLDDTPIGPDFDTVVFSDVLDNYTIETLIMGDNGTPDDVTDDVVKLIRVTDIGTGLDGVDLVWNVERLQFADQALVFNGFNGEPEGLLTLNDNTPTEDQLLNVSISGVTDSNNPDGTITGPVTYYWQMEGTGGIFTDILIDDGVTTKPVTGETFRPTDLQVGFALRVRAVYKDANNVIEEVFSAPTAPVIGINDAPVGTVLINDTAPTETQALVALIAFTDADAPVDLVGGGVPPPIVYNYQWQQANDPGVGGGAAGFTNIAGATAQAFTPTEAQVNHELRVVVSYIDGQGFAEQVLSAPTVVTGDFFVGGGGNDVWIGTEGQDIASGNGGNDIFSGLGGDDILNGNAGADVIDGDSGNDLIAGGTGNDALNGGDGNDTFLYTIGDGADGVNGGADVDTLQVSGTGGNDTLDVLFDETLPLVLEGGALADVESVTADLLGGIDTLSYAGTTNVNVTANLTTGTASGFTALANIENLIGGNGHDTLIGDSLGNVLTGGSGDDTLSGAAGDDTFLYTIGQGADAVDGGADADTLQITGTAAANTLDVIFNGTALTNVEGGTVANVEVVTANLGGGSDTVHYGATTAPVTVNLATGTASGFTSITNIENVTAGVGNDTLTGSTGAAILNTLNGGAGDDTYIVDGGETVIEAAAGGTDTVLSSAATFTLGANVENLTLTGTGNSNGTGNGAANALTGNVGDNLLSGAAGNDTLIGDAGDDTLIGGTGNDTLNGGAGNDTFNYTIGQGADAVDGGADTDTLTITGTAAANTLNVLFNGTALTTFAGGTVTGIEVVTADLGGGVDTVNYGATTASVTADLATGTASGFTSITNIENVTAGVGNDTLTGDANANTLNGGAGNDILHITAGNDILNGGADNDVFVFDAPAFDSTINGFDANPVGGQDLLDISARGITAATFATAVNITAEGTGTMIDFGNPAVAQFHLVGVNAAAITATDFILAS